MTSFYLGISMQRPALLRPRAERVEGFHTALSCERLWCQESLRSELRSPAMETEGSKAVLRLVRRQGATALR